MTTLGAIGASLVLLIAVVTSKPDLGTISMVADRPVEVVDDHVVRLDVAAAGDALPEVTATPVVAPEVATDAGDRPARAKPVRQRRSPSRDGGAQPAPVHGAAASSAPAREPTPTARPRTTNGAAPPQVSTIDVDDQPVAGEPVVIRWWAGDDDGYLRGAEIDFGDGSFDRMVLAERCAPEPHDPVAERPSFEHVFAEPGSYRVVITVVSGGACGEGPLQSGQRELVVEVAILTVRGPEVTVGDPEAAG